MPEKIKRNPDSVRSRWYTFLRKQVCPRFRHRWREGRTAVYCSRCRSVR